MQLSQSGVRNWKLQVQGQEKFKGQELGRGVRHKQAGQEQIPNSGVGFGKRSRMKMSGKEARLSVGEQ